MSQSRTSAEARQAVIGILSRPGDLDTMADEICQVFAHVAKPAITPTLKCQAPDDPHAGTDLVGGRCPICLWSPA